MFRRKKQNKGVESDGGEVVLFYTGWSGKSCLLRCHLSRDLDDMKNELNIYLV